MSVFKENQHPRGKGGKFVNAQKGVADITLGTASRKLEFSLEELKFAHPEALKATEEDPAIYRFAIKSGRKKVHYEYDARTQRATDADGQTMRVIPSREILKSFAEQQGSKAGIDRIQETLREVALQSDTWTPSIPKGVALDGPIFRSVDAAGDPIASFRYKERGEEHIVTSGPKGAVSMWRHPTKASLPGTFLVHDAFPTNEYDEAHGPQDCKLLHSGCCYPDTNHGLFIKNKAKFDDQSASLDDLYNEMFAPADHE